MDYQFASLGPALRMVVLVFLLIFALLLLGFLVFLAILPRKIAKARAHPQSDAIAICGWVGLPSGILWALALIWAFYLPKRNASPTSASNGAMEHLISQVNQLERSIAALETSRQGTQS